MEPQGRNTFESLPLDIWKEVLLRCDYEELLNLRRVSHQFHSLINNEFWRKKCKLEGITLPPAQVLQLARKNGYEFNNWHLYHYASKNRFDPYGGNLFSHLEIKEEEMLTDWSDEKYEIDTDAYHYEIWGCKYETPPDGYRVPGDGPQKCLAFYGKSGARTITIDLKAIGVQDWIMDHLRPHIVIKEKIAPCFDFPAGYSSSSMIMACKEGERWYDMESIDGIGSEIEIELEKDEPWREITHRLEEYPSEMRSFTIRTEGLERNSRTEYYGIKVAETEIRLEFPQDKHWHKKE